MIRRRGNARLQRFHNFGFAVFPSTETQELVVPQVDTDNFAMFTLPKLWILLPQQWC